MRHRQVLTYAGHQFVQTHYTEWGAADNPNVVLCIHGLTRNSRDFDELALALRDQFRVVCVDVVGRGRSGYLLNAGQYDYPSYVSQLTGVLAHINASHVNWIGTSMGGILGMLLAATPNSPIRKMVISDVGPVIPKQALEAISSYLELTTEFESLAELEQHLRIIHSGFGDLTDQQWHHLALHSAREQAGKWHLHYDPAIASAFGPISDDVDLTLVWEQVHCPVLVLRGAQSTLLTASLAKRMAQRPNVTVQEFADVGHAPMMMSTDQIEFVRQFLKTEPGL